MRPAGDIITCVVVARQDMLVRLAKQSHRHRTQFVDACVTAQQTEDPVRGCLVTAQQAADPVQGCLFYGAAGSRPILGMPVL
eukprot:362655-Chlamydomonas_euryale.AAC.9